MEAGAVAQPHYGPKRLILLIGLMNMYMPLSLDMYTPSLPDMGAVFHTTPAMVNLTLTLFMVFYTVGILIFGPVSDKYGRKRVLTVGLFCYVLGSVGCALSPTIFVLLFARSVQALGGGAASAMSVALVKDLFPAKIRGGVLAAIQCISFGGPLVAPLIGGVVVQYATWRLTFWILTGFALLNLLLILPLREPLPAGSRVTGKLSHTFKQLLVVGRNPGFLAPLLIVSVFYAPYMAYVAIASFVYMTYFALNAQVYSYFFAINSFFALVAPILYAFLRKKFKVRGLFQVTFLLTAVMGVLMAFTGWRAPILFLVCLVPYTMMENGIRPIINDLLLSQQEGDTGSASALINAVSNALCSVGMMLGGLSFANPIAGFGGILATASVLCAVCWFVLMRSNLKIRGLNQEDAPSVLDAAGQEG